MEQGMKVTGKKINSTEKAWKLGPMVQATEVTTLKVKNTAQVVSLGLMAVLTLVNFTRTT